MGGSGDRKNRSKTVYRHRKQIHHPAGDVKETDGKEDFRHSCGKIKEPEGAVHSAPYFYLSIYMILS